MTQQGFLIATNSDADRIMEEELKGLDFELIKYDWYKETVFDGIKKIGVTGKVGADFNSPNVYFAENDIANRRVNLTDFEIERYKIFCDFYANIITEYCLELKGKYTEREIAAGLNYECFKNGIRLPVLMVGSDERVFNFRHPCATDKKIEKYVLKQQLQKEKDCVQMSQDLFISVKFQKI